MFQIADEEEMPIEYFLDQTIKNAHTRKNYLSGIRTLMKFCDTEDFHDLLEGEPKELEDRMVACLKHLVEQGMNRSTIFGKTSAWHFLYVMNRLAKNVDWEYISKHNTADAQGGQDRAYTKEIRAG